MDTKDPTARPTAVGSERKLAAILSADVAGYSRLMGEDEVGALRTLTSYRVIVDALIARHHGRIVGTAGDSVLAEFPSVVNAVQCAVEMQTRLRAENANLPPERQMAFRIGINLGDVMVEGETIYGDGVNIAARLESLAEPGGICLSGAAYDQVENKLALRYENLGEQTVKNIKKPVRTYRVNLDGEAVPTVGAALRGRPQDGQPHRVAPTTSQNRWGSGVRWPWIVTGLALVAVTLVAVRYFSLSPSSTQSLAPSTQSPIPNPQPLPLPDKPSIVVLPFDNMSKDPEQEYFSNGITEVLTSDLSRIASLFVIARNTAFTYKGKATNVQDIGKELGVRYALEGSVQKAADQVRIVAQLVDTTTGGHLWSQRFDRPFKDIFALQDEIVQKIVTTLKLQLTLMERGILVRKTTDNLEAYDFYLRGSASGLRVLDETKKEENTQARQMFEKAIELDPQYAEAYARLSLTYFFDWYFSWNPTPQVLEQFSELARKALMLDDSLPGGHIVLSYAYLAKRQYEQAIAGAERAVALAPNSPEAHRNLGIHLVWAGRPEEAIGLIQEAMRLNPRYSPLYLVHLGWAYLEAGRCEEALVPLKQALLLLPNSPDLHRNFVRCYTALGQEEDAQAEGAEILRLIPNFSVERFRSLLPYKDPAMLERHLAALRKAGLK